MAVKMKATPKEKIALDEALEKVKKIIPSAKICDNYWYVEIIQKRNQHCLLNTCVYAKKYKYNLEISGFTEEQINKLLETIKDLVNEQRG